MFVNNYKFLATLQYATGVSATVIGKPSAEFFNSALTDLGVLPEQVSTL